jgi:hypothetical protein
MVIKRESAQENRHKRIGKDKICGYVDAKKEGRSIFPTIDSTFSLKEGGEGGRGRRKERRSTGISAQKHKAEGFV